MGYYPIYLDLRNRPVLVVGGGNIAEGKIEQLLKADARIHVVSPELTSTLAEHVQRGMITWRKGEFSADDLDGVMLVISATNSQPVNESVAQAAAQRSLLCNVVDQPQLCNFITPAVVTRGRLQISISTGGGSPVLAQRVKREVGALIGEEYGELLEIAAELRATVHHLLPDYDSRRDLLRAVVESNALELLRAGRRDEAERLTREIVAQFCAQHPALDLPAVTSASSENS